MFDYVTVLAQVDNYSQRVAWEAIEIFVDHTTVTRDIWIVLSST